MDTHEITYGRKFLPPRCSLAAMAGYHVIERNSLNVLSKCNVSIETQDLKDEQTATTATTKQDVYPRSFASSRGLKQLKEAFKNALSFHSSVFYQATLEDSQLRSRLLTNKTVICYQRKCNSV
jgi:hypothetical protein